MLGFEVSDELFAEEKYFLLVFEMGGGGLGRGKCTL